MFVGVAKVFVGVTRSEWLVAAVREYMGTACGWQVVSASRLKGMDTHAATTQLPILMQLSTAEVLVLCITIHSCNDVAL